jgi:sigma-E factor negative regulatory protein RseB
MRNKRTNTSFAWGFFALVMSAVAAAADEPREWLERMNNALTTRNYDGVFTHWQDGKVELLRIIHRVKDGQVSERLVSLDGSGREFIRTDGELACYLPDKKTVLVEKRADRNPLLGNFPTFDQASLAFYDVKQVSRARIYRRDTRVIQVTPKDQFRYGYRLWIDEGTAMPLRTQLCDARGRVIEQLVLAEDKPLRINTTIPDSAFQPEVSTEGFRWLRTDSGVRQALSTTGERDRWNASQLPPGYRVTIRALQVMPGSAGPVEHFVFSDGLASVSVFVEAQVQPPASPAPKEHRKGPAPFEPGFSLSARSNSGPTSAPAPSARSSQPTAAEMSGVSQFGSTSAFSTVIEGHKVTAVGEVPPETVRAIANSVKSAPLPRGALSLQGPPPR